MHHVSFQGSATASDCWFLHRECLMIIIIVVSLPQAYIHTRMRAKTSDFLKVLNRARPDAEKKEMKTISYVASLVSALRLFSLLFTIKLPVLPPWQPH